MAETGDNINGYKIVKEINQGNFCIAYKVQKGGEYFFMKEYISPTPLLKDEYRAFINHQAKFISRLKSLGNNVEQTIEHFEGKYHYFQVKRFIEGESLEKWMKNPANSKFETRRDLVVMICDVLSTIHKAGIIHKDLKPAQFMVVKDAHHSCGYRLILTDFDWSIIDGVYLQPVATPGYGSLEQDEKTISVKSDIFTFGIMLSELLTGAHPYSHNANAAGLTPELWYNWVNNKRYKQPRENNPAISKGVNDVIVRCLDPVPANRPSLEEIKAALITPAATPSTPRKYNGICLKAAGAQIILPVNGAVQASIFQRMFPNLKDAAGNPVYRYFESNVDVLKVGYINNQITLATSIVKNRWLLNGRALSTTPSPVNNGDSVELYSTGQGKTVAKFSVELR